MKYLFTAIILFGFFTLSAKASEEPQLIISEFSTGSMAQATQEFIEIANIGTAPADLTDVVIEYMPASASSWQTKATLQNHLLPNNRIVISTDGYIEGAAFIFSGGLAASGGHLRISQTQIVLDEVGWGSAKAPLGEAAVAPGPGESAKRLVTEDGYFSSQQNNLNDWFVSTLPSPRNDGLFQPKPEAKPPENEEPIQQPQTTSQQPDQAQRTYAPIKLSELMPDPTAPLTDAADEFIELYNPNSNQVNLDGYYFLIGTRRTPLDGYVIEAKTYLAVFSSDTSISLSNQGKTVELFDGSDRLLDQATYPKAEPGISWSLYGASWVWSAPSPGEANPEPIYLAEDETSSANEVSPRNRDYGSGAAGSTLSSSEQRNRFEAAETAPVEAVDYTILAGVGALSVCYVLYEYRKDMAVRFQQFKRYLRARREDRSPSEGRGSDRVNQRRRWGQNRLRAWISARNQH